MADNTEIIIIAPEFLMDLAEDAAEEISGYPGFKATSFEVSSFLKKPRQQRMSRFFISLGDANDNGYTAQVLTSIQEGCNQNGVCISYNTTHAFIFGETDYGEIDNLKRIGGEIVNSINTLKKKIFSKLKDTDKSGSADPADSFTLIQSKSESKDHKASRKKIKKAMKYASPSPVEKFFWPLFYFEFDSLDIKLQRTIVRKKNTQIALEQFLANDFKKWAKAITEE